MDVSYEVDSNTRLALLHLLICVQSGYLTHPSITLQSDKSVLRIADVGLAHGTFSPFYLIPTLH